VKNLKIGDPVWTVNEEGDRVLGKIERLGSIRVPANYHVIHIRLSDGRELYASPRHPTANGQTLAGLNVGDLLDGAYVIQFEHLPYDRLATYDILPSGDTGFYWANGILMGSTLANP